MGRWSECSAVIVFQVVLLAMLVVAVVMSGEVGCWSLCGFLVGVLVFSMVELEFCIVSAISVPLWSSVCECHVVECALMSPVVMLVVMLSMYAKVFVISVSSVAWSGSVVRRGGMYRLMMFMCLCCVRCILVF